MENVIKIKVFSETSEEENSPESYTSDTVMEIINTELDQSPIDIKADKQLSMEISPGLEEKREDKKQGLFAPFSHQMTPDLEYIRLELEQSASNQEAATKLINDRYKLIMESAERRKEKEQKDRTRFTFMNEKVMKTTQLSHLDNEDIKKTTQLLHNMNLTPDPLTKDLSEEFSDKHLEKIYWDNGLNRFIELNYVEINTEADISSLNMLNTVTNHHECRVEDALRNLKNEQKEGGKRITFSQASQKLGNIKCKKDTQIFCEENYFIGSTFEELLNQRYESLNEV